MIETYLTLWVKRVRTGVESGYDLLNPPIFFYNFFIFFNNGLNMFLVLQVSVNFEISPSSSFNI